jgi:hypothetical protein
MEGNRKVFILHIVSILYYYASHVSYPYWSLLALIRKIIAIPLSLSIPFCTRLWFAR